jgi:hypothetical protein
MNAPDTFVFICAGCGYKARLPTQFGGRTIKCPGCQQPQVAVVQAATQRKTATISRVAMTPVPFSLPNDQGAALDAVAVMTPGGTPIGKTFPSPLPGAVQVITDRISRQASPAATGDQPPTAKPAFGATIEFACTACKARLRLPAHYSGKTILCPKCQVPQKVVPPLAPMDTTRTLAQGPGPQTDTPMASPAPRVRVTPLPQTYPTPTPTADSALVPAVTAPSASTPESTPVATPVATTTPPAEESLLDALASVTADEPTPTKLHPKPHPSRTKTNVAGMTMDRPVSVPVAVSAPAHPPSGSNRLIIALGVLALLSVVLAASFIYLLVVLQQTQRQLNESEQAAKAATTHEQEASTKLSALEKRLSELEQKLAASTPPPVAEPAAQAPAPVVPATTTVAPAAETPTPATQTEAQAPTLVPAAPVPQAPATPATPPAAAP